MKQRTTILSLSLVLMPVLAFADIKPAALFSNNMVLQRDTNAPVWGWGDPGEEVSVTGSWGASSKATADESGKWKVLLDTPPAGGPHTITLEGKNKVILENVLSGDVWLCSGQSNMEWSVSKAQNPAEEAAAANHPRIRHFMVQKTPSLTGVVNCVGEWKVCSPETVSGFSATAYFTGRELERNLDIPIGLLVSCWGGTCVEAWTKWSDQSEDFFALERKETIDAKAENYTPAKAQAAYEKKLKAWNEALVAAKAEKTRPPRKPLLPTDPRLDKNYPANLYNGMITPLLPFAIKGAVWYQGESNTKTAASAIHYRVQLQRMVQTWRRDWGNDFPFFAVQLPEFKAPQEDPVQSADAWPAIRESVVHATQNMAGVFTATMLGLGEAGDIHPKNKQGVGQRMASTILNKVYGKETPTTPFLKSSSIDGDKVLLDFEFTGSGLEAKGDKLQGFAIAGEDKNFVWAEADILPEGGGSRVAVHSPEIKSPVAVRYAWANNPAVANLQSKEGFPASPFRTDDWSLETQTPTKKK